MSNSKHVVVFSHGFGVCKDSRGLFTAIADALPDCDCVLFDYSEFDEVKQAVVICPFSEQVLMLEKVLADAIAKYPNAIIDIIASSQGDIITAMLKPVGIRRFVLLVPPMSMDKTRTIERSKRNPGTVIDFNGVTKLVGRSGNAVLVPAMYWQERDLVKPVELYNNLASGNDVVVINAEQDDILDGSVPDDLSKNIKILSTPGDHNFTGETRAGLVECVRNLLV